MILTRLIYASKVAPQTKGEDIQQIMDTAKKNNQSRGLSGALIYSNKYFLQVLEGGRTEVNKLYQKILQDERHIDPILIDYSAIDSRSYDQWSMRLFLETNINRAFNFKYSALDDFDPFHMNREAAIEFLKNVSQNYKETKEMA